MGDEQPSAGDPPRQTVVIRPVVASGELSGSNPRRRAPSLPRPVHALVVALTVAMVVGGGALIYSTRSTLEVDGLADGQRLTRGELATLTVRVTSAHGTGDVRVRLNGDEVPATPDGDGLIVSAGALRDRVVEGMNRLVVSQPGRFGIGGSSLERAFTFDPTGPSLMVPAAVPVSTQQRPTVLRGLVDGAASLTADGRPVTIEPGGAFTVQVAIDAAAVTLLAADAEGNTATVTVAVTANAAASNYPATVGVHMTARSWADPAVREPILELARRGLINAVQLDVKDESGEVGYASTVPLAISTGAARGHYDAVTALDELHALGVRVIGRIVCFLDPVVATWAWENDRSDMIVLQGSGGPLATDYGTAAFTNLASAEVRQYLIDLAVEAAALGFDEILYDYVRRPEGDTSAMYFPGLQIAPDVVVARFVADSNAQLSRTDALLGVSVFGIAATRPDQIAQDIRLLAPHVDYVAPMVYPSHWGAGEYDVADPLRQPGAIVLASVGDFAHVVAGSGAAVVPWLQDFSAGGVPYGSDEVRAQIDAALAAGASGVLLWNSGAFYTAEALQQRQPTGGVS